MTATPLVPTQLPAELLALFGVLPGAHLLLSPALVVEAASEAYLTATHSSRADLLGQPLAAVATGIGAQYATAWQALLEQAHATGQPLERAASPAAGGHWQLSHAPVLDAQGRVQHVLHTALDQAMAPQVAAQLPARETRERTTEVQRQRLYAGLQQLPALLAVHQGSEQVFCFVNSPYQRLFSPRRLRGQSARTALPEVVGQGFWEALDQVYQTGEPFQNPEMELQLATPASGQVDKRYFHVFFQALRDEQQRISGVLDFAFDVTAQVLARRQVQQLNEELAATNAGLADYIEERTQQMQLLNEQLTAANVALDHTNQALRVQNKELDDTNQQLARTNEELDSFVYTASHDLQGPIANLQGLLQALDEELPAQSQPAPVAHILELMHDSAARFRRTLGRLTATAHWPATSAPLPSINLADLVRDVLLDLALPIAGAGAQLTVDVADCPDPALAEKDLYSLIYNLVSNAIKYRHPGRAPQVHVQCYTETNHWVLLVQDNGLGLDLAAGQPLFGLFQRFHAHIEGSGVGLYLVKRIVEHAGGYIEVASQLGVGSTFTVYLKRG